MAAHSRAAFAGQPNHFPAYDVKQADGAGGQPWADARSEPGTSRHDGVVAGGGRRSGRRAAQGAAGGQGQWQRGQARQESAPATAAVPVRAGPQGGCQPPRHLCHQCPPPPTPPHQARAPFPRLLSLLGPMQSRAVQIRFQSQGVPACSHTPPRCVSMNPASGAPPAGCMLSSCLRLRWASPARSQ